MKTLKRFTLLMFLVSSYSLHAQKTDWVKIISDQPSKISALTKSCVDKDNNFYIMANFEGSIIFGQNLPLESAGGTDVFVVKIEPEGEYIQWEIQISGAGNIEGKNICIDKDNNLYVTGSFEGETTFGETTIKPKHKYGFFVAKYNADGEFQWVKQGGN